MFGNTLARIGYAITVAIWLVAIPFIIMAGVEPLFEKKPEQRVQIIEYFFTDEPLATGEIVPSQEPTITAKVIFASFAVLAALLLVYFVGSWSSIILRKFMNRLRIRLSSASLLIMKLVGLMFGVLLLFLPFALLHSIAEPYIFVGTLAGVAALCFITQHGIARATKQPVKKLL